MSMAESELRKHGLAYVRGQVAAGKATKQDIERWEAELGPEVQQIVRDAAPPKARRQRVSKVDHQEES